MFTLPENMQECDSRRRSVSTIEAKNEGPESDFDDSIEIHLLKWSGLRAVGCLCGCSI